MNIFGIDIYGSIRDSGSLCSLSQHLKMSNTKQHIKILKLYMSYCLSYIIYILHDSKFFNTALVRFSQILVK